MELGAELKPDSVDLLGLGLVFMDSVTAEVLQPPPVCI